MTNANRGGVATTELGIETSSDLDKLTSHLTFSTYLGFIAYYIKQNRAALHIRFFPGSQDASSLPGRLRGAVRVCYAE
jgi:hypothetical protein